MSMHAAELQTTIATTATLPDSFSSAEEFNAYCRKIAHSSHSDPAAGEQFRANRAIIADSNGTQENVISTPWGGVVITFRNDPKVEKFLVVEAGKWLAFEKHAEKVETLEVHEGSGLLIYHPQDQSKLASLELKPGASITLQPGQEHCIIAISDLLVFEKSMDYKGMDKDLVFIYMPSY